MDNNDEVKKIVAVSYDKLNSFMESSGLFVPKKRDITTVTGIIKSTAFGLSRDIWVKRFNYKGHWNFLVKKSFGNKAKRLYHTNLRLYEKGLPVPKPITYFEPSLKQKYSFFLSDFIDNADNLASVYINRGFTETKGITLLLSNTLAEWHLSGAVHGDLKWSNILLQNSDDRYEFFLIDLDQSKLYSAPSIRGIVKDLKRFYRYSLELNAEEWVKSSFFPAYSSLLPDNIRSRIDLTSIVNRARKEWIRKGERRI